MAETGYKKMSTDPPEQSPDENNGPLLTAEDGPGDDDDDRESETWGRLESNVVELEASCKLSPGEAQKIYKDMLHRATEHEEFSLDIWGAMFFVIVKDFPDLFNCETRFENLIRTVFVSVCYFLNIFLQLALLYWICSMVTLPQVRQAQDMYKDFHNGAFGKDGEFDSSRFNDLPTDWQGEICQIVLSSTLFLSSILFLWVAQCFSELRTIWRRVRQMRRLPDLPKGFKPKEMVAEVIQGEGHFKERKMLFICIDRCTQLSLYMLIFIPKIFIASLLCCAGCVWLTASLSFGDLILNSLALAFVVEVDELIFSVFLPPRLEKNLKETMLAIPVDTSLSEEEIEKADVKNAYTRSAVFLALVFGFVVVFVFTQPVLPGYDWDVAHACEAFNAEHLIPHCYPWSSECFPKGGGGD